MATSIEQQPEVVLQKGQSFALSSTLSSSSPSSVAVIPNSSSSSLSTSSLGSSSSGMTMQDRGGQDDMSRGEGGPPRVRYPAGGHATSKTLFVDCSVEYELPKMAKIPSDSLPLLMIHPKWQNNKPMTRSSSQQQLHQQQQQVGPVVQHQFQLMQQQQQTLFHNGCPQCPVEVSMTSSRGRKRPLNEFQPPEARVKRSADNNSGEIIVLRCRTVSHYFMFD